MLSHARSLAIVTAIAALPVAAQVPPNQKNLVRSAAGSITCEVLLFGHLPDTAVRAQTALRQTARAVGLRQQPATPDQAQPGDAQLLDLAREIHGYMATRNPPAPVLKKAVTDLAATLGQLQGGRDQTPPASGPVLGPIKIPAIAEPRTYGPFPLDTCDPSGAGAGTTITAASSDAAVMPVANITLAGNGTYRAITLRTVPGATGVAEVTLTARNAAGQEAIVKVPVSVVPRPQ